MLQQYSPNHRGVGGEVTNEGELQGGTLPEGLWRWAFCIKEDPCLLPPDHGSNGHQWTTLGRLVWELRMTCISSESILMHNFEQLLMKNFLFISKTRPADWARDLSLRKWALHRIESDPLWPTTCQSVFSVVLGKLWKEWWTTDYLVSNSIISKQQTGYRQHRRCWLRK